MLLAVTVLRNFARAARRLKPCSPLFASSGVPVTRTPYCSCAHVPDLSCPSRSTVAAATRRWMRRSRTAVLNGDVARLYQLHAAMSHDPSLLPSHEMLPGCLLRWQAHAAREQSENS